SHRALSEHKTLSVSWSHYPIAPIYQYTNGRLIKPWLKGYPINNPEDVAYSRTMYIVKH
ncbi:hypothetical protein, partial [Escherichia coli]|uniref:hypothetical protein n=1 Tax=Escherichia coli TaxID=562 RepID=UPI0020192C6F